MCSMYYTPEQMTQIAERRVFLTPLSLPLLPHVDTIAMIETCDLGIGEIHGHEASNPQRSPGRSGVPGPGRGDMGANEPVPYVPGNQLHYSSTPTPAALHDHFGSSRSTPASRTASPSRASAANTPPITTAPVCPAQARPQADRRRPARQLPRQARGLQRRAHPEQAEALIKVLDRRQLAVFAAPSIRRHRPSRSSPRAQARRTGSRARSHRSVAGAAAETRSRFGSGGARGERPG